VQEHHATALHWDLRLERDGVLASWAVPKGIPKDPRENGLAVHTEDHPLMYLDFHGDIPKGNYGAGSMTVWDTGTYVCEKWEEREVIVVLHGERARGRYVLFQRRGNQWMIHRMDPAEDPTRELMPKGLRPMVATAGDTPDDEAAWGFEVWWDGLRAVTSVEGGRVRVDLAHLFPELREMGRAIGSVAMVLDGDLVALGDDGRPDRARLERRAKAASDSAVRRLAEQVPVTYMIHDLLWLEGHSSTALGAADRRRLLDELELAGRAWQTPPSHPGEGAALLSASGAQKLAGVLAKRLDSPYAPGTTSPDWLTIRA
jgi:bifunctional non-homologous end joining protein LigD